MDKLNSIKGALYGVAIGDALGGPLEFMSKEEIQEKHGEVTEMIGGGWLHLNPGEVTDDTQMTLCVARGIVANPELPVSSVGNEFVKWYDSCPKDIGNACRLAIGIAKEAGNWFYSAEEVSRIQGMKSEGNGALMRTIYTALYYKENHISYTKAIARMTHNGEESTLYCVQYCDLVVKAINGELEELPPFKLQEPSGYVKNSYMNAICAVDSTLSFEKAVIHAVNNGGDADTIGAITGGLAGAMYGYGEIPKRWIDALDTDLKNYLDFLAEKAYCKN